jgi:hypothetical protein
MGRPKGSKNKPKTDAAPKAPKAPKPDKKVNFTLLNQTIAAFGQLATAMAAEISARAAHHQAIADLMSGGLTGGLPEPTVDGQATIEAAIEESKAEEAKTDGAATAESAGTEPESKPTDLGSVFGTEDPVSK